MAGILNKIFDPNKREIKRLTKMSEAIVALADDMAKLSDDELREKNRRI